MVPKVTQKQVLNYIYEQGRRSSEVSFNPRKLQFNKEKLTGQNEINRSEEIAFQHSDSEVLTDNDEPN